MLRKTLIALTAVAALSMGSGAAVAHGGGHGGGHGGWSGRGMAPMHGSWGGRSMAMAPMRGNWGGHPFTRSAVFHNRFHRFHHRNAFFFAAGFAGPGYDSCWVWTSWGWRYVCGYPYGY